MSEQFIHITDEFKKWVDNDVPYLKQSVEKILNQLAMTTKEHEDYAFSKVPELMSEELQVVKLPGNFEKHGYMSHSYNPWPLGNVPDYLRRPEPEIIRGAYPYDDAREIIDIFERKVAKFTGAKYAVAVDCCTHGLELAIRYEAMHDRVPNTVSLPAQTYISVPMMLKQLGYTINFLDFVWTGQYCLLGTRVIDAAVRFMPDMYIPGTLQCVSFQIKKRVCIGRGGMILTDDKQAYEWLSLARYDGRDMSLPYDHPEHIKMHGWHYYMTPEDAARGIIIMDSITDYSDTANQSNYPNVEEMMKNI